MKILYTIVRQTKAGFAENKFIHFSKIKEVTLTIFAVIMIAVSAQAQAGQALDFDGTTSYVNIGNVIPSGSYTKEAWINARTLGAGGHNIISGSTTAFWVSGGFLCAGHNFNYFRVSDPAPLSTGVWYHVALTFNAATNELILYKNGVAVSNSTNPADVLSETVQYIGAYNNGGGPGFNWDGQIDDVRIWNVVRTPAQIAASYNCNLTNDEFGLVSNFDFNQGTGGGNNTSETTLLNRIDKCFYFDGTLSGFALTGATSNWVSTGSPASGSCGGTYQNINVTGLGNCINDGDNVVHASDGTSFGSNTSRTFVIQNTGTAPLTITSVTLTGPNADQFSITSLPSSPIAAGSSSNLVIGFSPTTNGDKDAVVNIFNDDPDEAAYDFSIMGAFHFLPVTLKNFIVKKDGADTKLVWTTASESFNLGFDIQRSADGITWTSLGFVNGFGNSDTEKNYSFSDFNPVKGVNYYRLKQVDLDGKSKLSEIRTVTFASTKTLVYPVPASDAVTIELPDNRLIGTIAYLTDMQGKLIRQVTINSLQQSVSLSGLQAGMYWIKLADGVTHKLIKQ